MNIRRILYDIPHILKFIGTLLKPLFIALSMTLLFQLTGCSDSKEEVAFRASLIDKALNDEVRQKGDAFLSANALRENVISLPTGLQYQVLQQGDGAKAKINQSVEVSYTGTLVNGEVFDSSTERGKNSIFPLKNVIAGWRMALLQMRVGDRWKIYLPADLAYGARSPSELIPANSALIFDIELLNIVSEANE